MTIDNDLIRRGDAMQTARDAALDKIRSAVYCHGEMTMTEVGSDADDVADAIAAIPAAPVSVGVKALPWVNDNWHSRIRAKTTIGDYVVWWGYKGECATLRLKDDPVTEHHSIEAAKAAAQADYAARILAALDVQPAPDVARIRADALREAAKVCMGRWAAHMESGAKTYEMDYAEAKKDANTLSVAANEAQFCADAVESLIDTPLPPDAMAGKVAALVEAAQSLMRLNDEYSPFGGEIYQDRIERTWDNLRAALAAMKGGAT
jgi:hypothetical protein